MAKPAKPVKDTAAEPAATAGRQGARQAALAARWRTVPAVATIRPMRRDDDLAVHEVSVVTFADLNRRLHEPPAPPPPLMPAIVRIQHLLERDPGGAWVAEDGGRMVGAALALDREGVWGLSLLVVLPEYQSQGVGRALLERSLEYAGGGEQGGDHPRLARPAGAARLRPRRLRGPPLLRRLRPPAGRRGAARPCSEGDERDIPLTEAVDRAVRGAAHGSDIEAFLRAHRRLFVIPDRGYAVLGGNGVNLLAALDEEAARDLLLRRARRGARPTRRSTSSGSPPRSSGRCPWCSSAGLRAEARRSGVRARRRGAVLALSPERRVPVVATVSGP